MLDQHKHLTTQQFHAALGTLNACIDKCPDALWNGPVVNLQFNQVVFHTLFYADVYLGKNLASLRAQPFHRENVDFFGDYEELEDRAQQALYKKPPIKIYMQYCRDKAARTIAAETAGTLAGPSGFGHLPFSRAELHTYNIRHIQHHAAQLIMRLRIDAKVDMPWFKSGWCDA